MKTFFPIIVGLAISAGSVAGNPYRYHPAPPSTLAIDADSAHSWNALHYELLLTVTPLSVPDSLFISGDLRIELTPVVAGLDTVDLHLVGLNVTGAQLQGVPCNYTRVDCLLYVALLEPHDPGERLFLDLDYNGVPVRTGDLLGGVGIFFPAPTMIYTQADPRGLRNWMPCWDEPWDKATIRQKLIFPSSFTVVANGELESIIPLGEWTEWIYFMDQPLATYLVSFCASDYSTFEQTAGSVAIKNYVYPQHLTAAQYDLGRVPEMIQTYSEFFGDYPFTTFGYAEAPVFGSGGGAMENQTMVTLGNLLITGNRLYEDLYAHELAHQWFGDATGYLDWPEMWLSEGFATYAEALWHQHLYGLTNYHTVMNQFQSSYLAWENPYDPHPMYDPPWDIIWSQLTYEKGACVLHLLRYETGDDLFFQILQNYFSIYCYGTASTGDLAAIVQEITNEDYDWFFDQWVYQPGYPSLEYFATTESMGGSTLLKLSVAQVQSENFPDFTTHADLYIFSGGDTTIERVEIAALPAQEILVLLPVAPDSVQLDPLSWILGYKYRRDDLTGPVLSAENLLIADAGGDGFLDPGESGSLSFLLTNSGLPTAALTLELTSMDAQLIVLDAQRSVPELGFYGQYDLAADPFPVENAVGSPPRWVQFRLQVNETASGNPVATLWFELPVGTPQFLLVDDDSGGEAEVKHQQALNNLEIVYRTVEYVAADSLPVLGDYIGVLWACGQEETNTLIPQDQSLLETYLNAGGALFLSGRNVAPDLDSTLFFQNVLHAQAQGTTTMTLLNGVDPLLAGMTFFISGQGSNQDILEPDGSAGSARLLAYLTGPGGAVKYEGSYKSCVFGFGFEDVQGGNPNFNEPEELLSPILDWFRGISAMPPETNPQIPAIYALGQNYPNPFNAETIIPLRLPERSQVRMELFNIRGQNLGTIYEGVQNAGWPKVRYNAAGLASGVYIYRITAQGLEKGGKFQNSGKMLVLK